MFSLNPLLSKTSNNDLILSSDIELSKEELQQIKNKIERERIVAPCWIHIGDKMYLIEKKQLETQSDKENKGSSQDSSKH
jgi:predicted HAD superfamily hydrolase